MSDPEEQEITDNEAYQEIMKHIKQRDEDIKTLKQKILKLEEEKNERQKEKPQQEGTEGKAVVGVCDTCGTGISREDAKKRYCPHCGKASTYTTI